MGSEMCIRDRLPGAQNALANDDSETGLESPDTDTTDTAAEVESGTPDETTDSDNEGSDFADDTAEVVPEQDENIDSLESISSTSVSTDTSSEETDLSTSESDSDSQGKTTPIDPIELDVPDSSPITPNTCLLYTSPSPRDLSTSRMPSSA